MTFAMLFPGQGSQSVGMLGTMSEYSEIVTDTFGEAGEVLQTNLWDVVANGPKDSLNQTAITQPAILTASVALWRIWCDTTDLRPSAMAGHSLGEYSALVCAGILSFTDAVALVARRGELMQAAVPEGIGAMAAILGLEDDRVTEVCAQCTDNESIVEAVNFNSPGQVVIAGHKDAVERASAACKEAGARRAQLLPVSVPAHSSLMKDAAAKFAELLNDTTFSDSSITVLQNVGIDQVPDVRGALTQQLYSPVPWTRIVRTLKSNGITHAVECGPGRVLAGLCRRIDKSITGLSTEKPDNIKDAIDALENCKGE